jgi:hypothetical protein
MNTQNYRVSHFEWTISLAWRKSRGTRSTNGSTDSGMAQSTSTGMNSGCKGQPMTSKLDMSERSNEHDEVSKMRQDDPNTTCAESTD